MTSLVLAIIVFVSLHATTCTAQPMLNISGFSWAENLAFDNNGNLFVADAQTGKIWRIYLDSSSNTYKKVVHISGFKGALGLAVAQNNSLVYCNVRLADEEQTKIVNDVDEVDTVSQATLAARYAIISFSPFTASSYRIVASLPGPGNGLALHYASGLLYATTEGFAQLGRGAVFEVDPVSGQVNTYAKAFTADGAFIDQTRHLLYITEVATARIIAYNLTNHQETYNYRIRGAVSLDDMCLTADGSELIGADFLNRTVVRWPSNGSGYASIQASNLKAPTSVRIGSGKGFNSSHIYVTEGGGLTKFQTNRNVIEFVPYPVLPH